jgi:hypothetical protein
MVEIEIVNVAPRDDIYFGVPLAVKPVQHLQLLKLPFSQAGEIFFNEFHKDVRLDAAKVHISRVTAKLATR